MKDKKKIAIIITLLIGIITAYGITKIFIDKKEKPIIKEVKKDKRMAIMVQSGDGYKEYVSKDDTWPGSDYVFSKAECVDYAGNKIDGAVTFADGKATVKSKKTVYCTLYFDEKPQTIELLREKDSQGYLSTDKPGGMYRYQATFEDSDSSEMTNWILFGTREKCEKDEEEKCTNLENMTYEDYIDKYMYRIIGITEEGELYLIKETFLKAELPYKYEIWDGTFTEGYGTINSFMWNDKASIDPSDLNYCGEKGCPQWNESPLFKRINGKMNGDIPTYENSWNGQDPGDIDIFVDNPYYDYLQSGDENGGTKASEWYKLIEEHEWMYGDTTYNLWQYYKADEYYAIETGNAPTTHYVYTYYNSSDDNDIHEEKEYTWNQKEKVRAKISLMYIHDYLYAYPDVINPGNLKNSWIHYQKDGYNTSPFSEWLSTRWGIKGSTDVDAWIVDWSGWVVDAYLDGAGNVRPVFYLSSKAQIASGDGIKENPYILGI